MIAHYEEYGVVMFRKHLHTYSKGYDGANSFRDKVNKTTTSVDMLNIIKEFF